VFFSLSSWALGLILAAVVVGATALGILLGRRLRRHADALREPFGALQAALLGLVALLMAFGLTMAVGRYESRRAAVVDDANTIGTAYLRAQTIPEPMRTRSLALLRQYTDASIRLSEVVPQGAREDVVVARQSALQRRLWSLAGQSLAASPTGSATRLYVDSLNSMIDQQTVRVAALNNRIPGAVLAIEVVGAAMALGLLALYLAIMSRGVVTVLLAAVFVTMLLLVTFDLDRPTRGLITVPDAALTSLRASMLLPPAAGP
jgi:hypothetical protein